jgi:hypothetical protein
LVEQAFSRKIERWYEREFILMMIEKATIHQLKKYDAL